MKNTALFAILFAFTLGISTPINAKQAPAATTEHVESRSQLHCCDDDDHSCCDATTGTACSWLATTWCSAKNWVMNLLGMDTCAAHKDDMQMIAETEQDPEADNIPFQKQ